MKAKRAALSLLGALVLASLQAAGADERAPVHSVGAAGAQAVLSRLDDARAQPCREIQNDAERLACYDRVFGRASGDLLPSEPRTVEQGAAEAPKRPESKEASSGEHAATSLLDERWQLFPESKEGPFHLKPYKPVYILAAFHASRTNDTPSSPGENNTVVDALNLTKTETKFQISLKSKLWQNVIGDYSDLWFGYTQSSRWQTLNAAESRPFRETDYEPELMLAFRTNYELLGWEGRFASIAINHQSNGRTEPLSRSWNRIVGAVGLERDGWTVMFRPWARLHEDIEDDDNPDIEDFMGRGELWVTRDWGGHEVSGMFRHSMRGGERSHSAFELDWAFPIRGSLSGYVQVFHGYGESLIDYNSSATFVGVGVSLVDWYARVKVP
jgi:phospholipase A1/A2